MYTNNQNWTTNWSSTTNNNQNTNISSINLDLNDIDLSWLDWIEIIDNKSTWDIKSENNIENNNLQSPLESNQTKNEVSDLSDILIDKSLEKLDSNEETEKSDNNKNIQDNQENNFTTEIQSQIINESSIISSSDSIKSIIEIPISNDLNSNKDNTNSSDSNLTTDLNIVQNDISNQNTIYDIENSSNSQPINDLNIVQNDEFNLNIEFKEIPKDPFKVDNIDNHFQQIIVDQNKRELTDNTPEEKLDIKIETPQVNEQELMFDNLDLDFDTTLKIENNDLNIQENNLNINVNQKENKIIDEKLSETSLIVDINNTKNDWVKEENNSIWLTDEIELELSQELDISNIIEPTQKINQETQNENSDWFIDIWELAKETNLSNINEKPKNEIKTSLVDKIENSLSWLEEKIAVWDNNHQTQIDPKKAIEKINSNKKKWSSSKIILWLIFTSILIWWFIYTIKVMFPGTLDWSTNILWDISQQEEITQNTTQTWENTNQENNLETIKTQTNNSINGTWKDEKKDSNTTNTWDSKKNTDLKNKILIVEKDLKKIMLDLNKSKKTKELSQAKSILKKLNIMKSNIEKMKEKNIMDIQKQIEKLSKNEK